MSRCYLNSELFFTFILFNHWVNIIVRNIFKEGNSTLWNLVSLTEPEQWMALYTQLCPYLLKKNRICKYLTLHLIICVSSITNRSNKICPTWMILSNVYNFWTWFLPSNFLKITIQKVKEGSLSCLWFFLWSWAGSISLKWTNRWHWELIKESVSLKLKMSNFHPPLQIVLLEDGSDRRWS